MDVPLLRLDYSDSDIEYIKTEIEKVLRSGYLTMASKVEEFEKSFARFCGTKYAIGTNSGTSALEIILRTIGVEGHEVIIPSNTYMATALAAIKAGAKIRFLDCNVANLQLCADELKKKISEKTRAVIIVHIGGFISPDLLEIKKMCAGYNVPLVEDAAHAHGAKFERRMAGSLSYAASFSFYPTKVLTTAEGGMITTNSLELYDTARILREHGKSDHRFNVHTEIGDNWRFSEIHAVLGIQQMNKVDRILAERRRLANLYNELLSSCNELLKLEVPDYIGPSFYKYILFLPENVSRKALKSRLKEKHRVQLAGEVYSDPCHNQPVFDKYPGRILNETTDQFPNTDYVCRSHICLPLYPGLRDQEAEYVVKALEQELKAII